MSDLMVRDGEDFARAGIQQLSPEFLACNYPSFLTQHAIKMNRGVHRRNAIFGQQNNLNTALAEELDQVADHQIDVAQVLPDRWIERATALQIVIKVWEVNEIKRGRVATFDPLG